MTFFCLFFIAPCLGLVYVIFLCVCFPVFFCSCVGSFKVAVVCVFLDCLGAVSPVFTSSCPGLDALV